MMAPPVKLVSYIRGRGGQTDPESYDDAPPASHSPDVRTAAVCSSISISLPAPEHFIVWCKLVNGAVEVREQHQLLVGMQRRNERGLPQDLRRASRRIVMISYRSLREELELAPLLLWN